jgi:hypothetical protein
MVIGEGRISKMRVALHKIHRVMVSIADCVLLESTEHSDAYLCKGPSSRSIEVAIH